MLGRRRFFLRFWMAALAAGLGCISTTLPIPPPLQPTVSASDEQGLVTLEGRANSVDPEANVYVRNTETNEGVFGPARRDGSWTQTIPARPGTLLRVWQEIHLERSASIEVQVPLTK